MGWFTANGGPPLPPCSPLALLHLWPLSPSSSTSSFGILMWGVSKEVVVAVPTSWWWLCWQKLVKLGAISSGKRLVGGGSYLNGGDLVGMEEAVVEVVDACKGGLDLHHHNSNSSGPTNNHTDDSSINTNTTTTTTTMTGRVTMTGKTTGQWGQQGE